MGDLTLTDIDRTLIELLTSRAAESGHSLEEVAKQALLRGLLWSPADRTAHADQTRAMTPGTLDDSTEVIRRMRDGA